MIRKKTLKRTRKAFVSLLLVFSVIASLIVPFDISVFAEETPAWGNDIHAFLYKYVDNSGIQYNDLYEFVIQKGDVPDPSKDLADNFQNHFSEFSLYSQTADIRPWNGVSTKIRKVVIKDKIKPESMQGWFYTFRYIYDKDFQGLENIDTSECRTMRYAFIYNTYLKKLDLRHFDVSKLENAASIFKSCFALEEIDISTWELPKCTVLAGLFSECKKLKTIKMDSFKPEKCSRFDSMFNSCESLENVYFPNEIHITSNNVLFENMFIRATNLKTVD